MLILRIQWHDVMRLAAELVGLIGADPGWSWAKGPMAEELDNAIEEAERLATEDASLWNYLGLKDMLPTEKFAQFLALQGPMEHVRNVVNRLWRMMHAAR